MHQITQNEKAHVSGLHFYRIVLDGKHLIDD